MTAPLNLIIRADATPTMGAGHVMRCLALAQAAHRQGMHAKIVGRIQIPWLLERLQHEHIPYKLLHDPLPAAEEEPARLLKDIEDTDWVILDGYHFTYRCQQAVCRSGKRLLLIDDYNHLPQYYCDILLNQNIGADTLDYKGIIGLKLLEPTYALLRHEFFLARRQTKRQAPRKTVKNILLSLGGGDITQHLKRVAPVLAYKGLQASIIKVIAGTVSPDCVQHILSKCLAQIEILPHVTDMVSLMTASDICITAGGSTCWELCCLGVPFLTVEVAVNQQRLIKKLASRKLALPLGHRTLKKILTTSEIPAQSKALQQLVDGLGAYYALNAMLQKDFYIRPVVFTDSENILQLANAPTVRHVSFFSQIISPEEHKRWFTARLARCDSEPFYIALDKQTSKFIGYVRFDKKETRYFVSIATVTEARGRGRGKSLLEQSCQLFFTAAHAQQLYAWVHKNNSASLRTFFSVGFKQTQAAQEQVPDFICLERSYEPY